MHTESQWPAAETPSGFVLRLTKALHMYGTPSYDLERTVNAVAKKLGFGLECFSLPTMIILSLYEGVRHGTYVIRVEPGDINLEKLTLTQDIADRILYGELNAPQAARELDAVVNAASHWGRWFTVASFGLVSAGVARVFGGDWAEIVSATLIGLIVGLLAVMIAGRRILTHLFPTIASALAAFCSYVFAHFFGHDSVYVTLVSGLIVLLPGLTITVGLAELATQNLVAGTARLAGAATLFAQMGFGVAFGDQVGTLLVGELHYTASHVLPAWTEWAAIFCAGIGFVVLFQSRVQDAVWIVLAGLIAYASSRFGTQHFGPITGAFVGAFTIGAASHIFRFFTHRPNQLMMVPGIILLVPGSMGFKSLTALLDQNIIAGLDTAFRMMLAGISLVIGLLMSSIFIIPVQREKKENLDEQNTD